ncbi:MAG TPA: PP2C family protein-serine/threonine phosphatase [Candidatus Polarisedimenticolaceae bacterium]|nr:PP2C family protein-serine/threonine phosphatase [Candidatus Polarisedimenticolaceae bacterium]
MVTDRLRFLADELENFTEIAKVLKPSAGEIPRLAGIDIDGVSLPLNGTMGGDHIVYLDFKQRYDLDARIAQAEAAGNADVAAELERNERRAGILLADVAGHRVTDALVAAMLHQAFLLGASYELEMFGQITTKLFEQIKTRFYESTNIKKLVTMLYGEITDQGRFRYFSAGHPPPLVFSREFGRMMPLGADRTVSETPIGLLAGTGSRTVNEIELLGSGDILLLATDGLTEHGEGRFVSEELERCLRGCKDRGATEICASLRAALLAFAPPADDISYVVIKRL